MALIAALIPKTAQRQNACTIRHFVNRRLHSPQPLQPSQPAPLSPNSRKKPLPTNKASTHTSFRQSSPKAIPPRPATQRPQQPDWRRPRNDRRLLHIAQGCVQRFQSRMFLRKTPASSLERAPARPSPEHFRKEASMPEPPVGGRWLGRGGRELIRGVQATKVGFHVTSTLERLDWSLFGSSGLLWW